MGPYQSLQIALRALAANKLRSALTMLGMIIGVSAVIALMSVGSGAQAMITAQVQSMGTNLLFVTPGSSQANGVKGGAGTAATLTLEDAEAIADPTNVQGITAVAPESGSGAQVVAGSQNTFVRVTGVTPEYQGVRNFHVAQGDFISKQNVDGRSLVAVLGSTTALNLFGDSDPIGQSIKLNRLSFRVIGVMETKGAQAMGNQDDIVFVPITTLQQRLQNQRTVTGGRSISSINVQVADEGAIDQVVSQIADLLRQRHKVAQDDFLVRSQADMLAAFDSITQTMTLLLGAIAGISLVVGGIGIMNIMLVSVTERTREIGIRKAVGAKRQDILVQFLIESIVVSVLGGGIGVLLGMTLSYLVSGIKLGGQSLPTAVTPDAIMMAFGVSAAVGLFFGIYPASRAASLNPIEALRYE
ncbi:MAG: FtsX-like permease family protein [Chloroflexota bacterium]|nr:MAG: FtsX-like permease family protein [Chloroflexota bacterium]